MIPAENQDESRFNTTLSGDEARSQKGRQMQKKGSAHSQTAMNGCPNCTNCLKCMEFQKVAELKEAGLVIYRHTLQLPLTDKEDGQAEIELTAKIVSPNEKNVRADVETHTHDVFILQNVKDVEITSADFLPEFEKKLVGCQRCQQIMSRAQNVLCSVSAIERNRVRAICEHCRKNKFKDTCPVCGKVVKKFLDARDKLDEEEQAKNRQIQMLLAKLEKLMEEKRRYKPRDYVYQDKELNKLMQKTEKPNLHNADQLLFQPCYCDLSYEERARIMEKNPYNYTRHRSSIGQRDVKIEKFPLLRKYHSDDSLITSFSSITEDMLKKKLKYFFPQKKKDKSNIGISSSELIVSTKLQISLEADKKEVQKIKSTLEDKYKDKGLEKKSREGLYDEKTKYEKPTKYSGKDEENMDMEKRARDKDGAKKSQREIEKFEKSKGKDYEKSKVKDERAQISKTLDEKAEKIIKSKEASGKGAKGREEKENTEMVNGPADKSVKGKEEKGKAKISKKAGDMGIEMGQRAADKGSKVKEEKGKAEIGKRTTDMGSKGKAEISKDKGRKEEKNIADMSKGAGAKGAKLQKKGKNEEKESIKNKGKDEKKEVEIATTMDSKSKGPKGDDKGTLDKKNIYKSTKNYINKEKEDDLKTTQNVTKKGGVIEKGEVNVLQKALAKQEKEKAQLDKSQRAHTKTLEKAKTTAEERFQKGEDRTIREAVATKKIPPVLEKAVVTKDATKNSERRKNEVNFKKIETLKSHDNLILQLVKVKRDDTKSKRVVPIEDLPEVPVKKFRRKKSDALNVPSQSSDLELDLESLRRKMPFGEKKENEIIIGTEIRHVHSVPVKPPKQKEPALYKIKHDAIRVEDTLPTKLEDTEASKTQNDGTGKGIVRYALSDRTFIEKGWTLLPTEKVVRKMNVYRMQPSHPEFNWFEHNKSKCPLTYDSGEKIAEIDENGRGRWYYRNGRLALDYYNCEEMNAQQRYVIYSSGEPDERGRSCPITVLGMFDYLGNGIVFDHGGKIRLKYNQTEGVVLDRGIGPVSHWKWHSLNDPPVLQQVMIDTHAEYKDPDIMRIGTLEDEDKTRTDNEEMLAIEFDNFIKEKNLKSQQKFKPFQISMKQLKINEQFSLKILNQASIYLFFRDGSTNLKLNLGMKLDHREIIDTDTAELGDVSNAVDRFPGKTDSIRELQHYIADAKRCDRIRTELDKRYYNVVPINSADKLTAAVSRPTRPLLKIDPSCPCKKPSTSTLYYDTRFT